MSFVKKVRKGHIPTPVLPSFNLDEWTRGYKKYRENQDCDRLYEAGVRMDAVLSTLRSRHEEIPSWSKGDEEVIAFVGLANQQMLALRERSREFQPNGLLNELEEFKIELFDGTTHRINEIAEATIEALYQALKSQGDGEKAVVTCDEETKIVLTVMKTHVAGVYRHLELVWQDCLWNGYEFVERKNGALVIAPNSVDAAHLALLRSITQYRREILRLEHANKILNLWEKKMSTAQKNSAVEVKFVKNLTVVDERIQVTFGGIDDAENHDAAFSIFETIDAIDAEFYKGLLLETPEKLSGASLKQLFNSWMVIRSISEVSYRELENVGLSDAATLSSYAPIFSQESLVEIVVSSTGYSNEIVSTIIKFLTYQRERWQTVWTQPLIPLAGDRFTFAFGATHHATPMYVLERWMAQTKIDVSRKGNPFEAQVRKRLATTIKSVHIEDHFQLVESDIEIAVNTAVKKEQIDLIFLIGNVVVVGEIKCSIVPTSPNDFHNNLEIVRGAVEQVRRKAKAIEDHKEMFRLRMKDAGVNVPIDAKVLPIVVVNNPIYAGFPFENVPVVDHLILSLYLRGELIELGRNNETGELVADYILRFYSDTDEALRNLHPYLMSPPQLRHMKRNVRQRNVAISVDLVDESLPEMEYVIFETSVSKADIIAAYESDSELGPLF